MKVRGYDLIFHSETGQSIAEYTILVAIVALPVMLLSAEVMEAMLAVYNRVVGFLTVYVSII